MQTRRLLARQRRQVRNRRFDSAGSPNLRIDPDLFLEMLPCFSKVSLAIRGRGISIFRSTSLSLAENPRPGLFEDYSSRFHLDPNSIREVILKMESNSPRHFEVDLIDTGRSLSVYPEQNHSDTLLLKALADRGKISRREVGAALVNEDWLDQELDRGSSQWQNQLTIIPAEKELQVYTEMRSEGLSFSTSFVASLVDRNEDIFRLAERDARTVVHYDTGKEDGGSSEARSTPPSLISRLSCFLAI